MKKQYLICEKEPLKTMNYKQSRNQTSHHIKQRHSKYQKPKLIQTSSYSHNENSFQQKQNQKQMEVCKTPLVKNYQQSHEQHELHKNVQFSDQYCSTHASYQLNYYCMKCFTDVCSECLLHGVHKTHDNKSFKKILGFELSFLINQCSDQLLGKITKIQTEQQVEKQKIQIKIYEILKTRKQATNYFDNLQFNINKQKSQILLQCDELLASLQKQTRKLENQMKQQSKQLQKLIKEIKIIKVDYFRYQNLNENDLRKIHQKKILQRKLIKNFIQNFQHFKHYEELGQKQKQNMNKFNENHKNNDYNKQNKNCFLLNKKIKLGIQNLKQSVNCQFDYFKHDVYEKFNKAENSLIQHEKHNKKNSAPEIHQKSYFSTEHTKISTEKEEKKTVKNVSPSLSPYRPQKLSISKSKKTLKSSKIHTKMQQNQEQSFCNSRSQHKAKTITQLKKKVQQGQKVHKNIKYQKSTKKNVFSSSYYHQPYKRKSLQQELTSFNFNNNC